MISKYTKSVDRKNPLNEYPTPQFRRESFYCLNGEWGFAVDDNPNAPVAFMQGIIVPFAPETPLSGQEIKIEKGQYLHYRKVFSLPEGFKKDRVLLHFEAVDQIADVFLNGVKIYHHEGGYLPFTVDCLELKAGENEIIVNVIDDVDNDIYPRGKQFRNPKGIWYTSTSGIWGSVWLESVPSQVIQRVKFDPDFDKKSIHIRAFFEGKATRALAKISYKGDFINSVDLDGSLSADIDLSQNFHPWSPEEPSLYDVEIIVNDDKILSYFAMRKFSVVQHNGRPVFGLNNKPYFLHGVLDQGYFPDGGLTPPCDQALIDDIELTKRLGFNMIRKHIKIESMRYYYHCDRLGIILMQDFVNAGTKYKAFLIYTTPLLVYTAPYVFWHFDDTKRHKLLGRRNKESRDYFEKEMPLVVERLYNVVSIGIWTLFNEGWGQFDSERLTAKLREFDSTRLIDSTSGWFDMGAGDFDSRHIYFRKPKMKTKDPRILSLTEFGGFVYHESGHHSGTGKGIHYARTKDKDALSKKFIDTYEKTLLDLIEKQGLSATVYTQFCDVEEEENGLVTYDREVLKVDENKLSELAKKLRFKTDD